MQVEETKLKDCFIIKDTLFKDPRGYFFESFNQQKFNELTRLNVQFVQDNQSYSSKGVLRGLHFQYGEFSQAKLVRVLNGRVLDVAVDLRRDSLTFGEHVAVELSEDNKKQLFVPRGFAHGFVVLSEVATFFYKCDNYFNKSSESCIFCFDVNLNIDWKLSGSELQLSDKDKSLPKWSEYLDNLKY
jgi:dTDP-4-dehydrorhamnose 3,5-epimerase